MLVMFLQSLYCPERSISNKTFRAQISLIVGRCITIHFAEIIAEAVVGPLPVAKFRARIGVNARPLESATIENIRALLDFTSNIYF